MWIDHVDRVLAGSTLVALAIFGATLGDARVPDPPSLSPAAVPDSLVLPDPPRPVPVPPPAALERAVDRGPFRPDRARPPERYRLPSVPGPGAGPAYAAAPTAHLPGVTLLGTVIYADGRGLAALALAGQQPRLVRVGESYEGYRVEAVTRTGVTLVGPDTTLTLRTPGSPQQPGQP